MNAFVRTQRPAERARLREHVAHRIPAPLAGVLQQRIAVDAVRHDPRAAQHELRTSDLDQPHHPRERNHVHMARSRFQAPARSRRVVRGRDRTRRREVRRRVEARVGRCRVREHHARALAARRRTIATRCVVRCVRAWREAGTRPARRLRRVIARCARGEHRPRPRRRLRRAVGRCAWANIGARARARCRGASIERDHADACGGARGRDGVSGPRLGRARRVPLRLRLRALGRAQLRPKGLEAVAARRWRGQRPHTRGRHRRRAPARSAAGAHPARLHARPAGTPRACSVEERGA